MAGTIPGATMETMTVAAAGAPLGGWVGWRSRNCAASTPRMLAFSMKIGKFLVQNGISAWALPVEF